MARGQTQQIQRQQKNAQPERNAAMIADRAAGMTLRQLRLKYGLSPCRISFITNGCVEHRGEVDAPRVMAEMRQFLRLPRPALVWDFYEYSS